MSDAIAREVGLYQLTQSEIDLLYQQANSILPSKKQKAKPKSQRYGPVLPDTFVWRGRPICYRYSDARIRIQKRIYSPWQYGKNAYHYLEAIRAARRKDGKCYIYLCPNGGEHWHISHMEQPGKKRR